LIKELNLFNILISQLNSKTKCKTLKDGGHSISEKWGVEVTASFTSSNIHPCITLKQVWQGW